MKQYKVENLNNNIKIAIYHDNKLVRTDVFAHEFGELELDRLIGMGYTSKEV